MKREAIFSMGGWDVKRAIANEKQEMFTEEFKNISVNQEMYESLFRFTPPEGVQVIDMTEGALKYLEEMKREKPPEEQAK